MQSEGIKSVTIRVSEETIAAAERTYGAKVTGLQAAGEGYFEIHRRTVAELRGIFTAAELSAIVDNMNGVGLTRQFQANAQILWAHLEDGNTYEYLFSKWGVDAAELEKKVRSLTAAQAYFLQEEANLFWYGPDKSEMKNLSDFVKKFE